MGRRQIKFAYSLLAPDSASFRRENGILFWLSILLVSFEICGIVGFIPFSPNPLMTLGVMVLAVLVSINRDKAIFNWGYFCFFLYLCLNLLINDPPHYFNAWQRLFLFVILLCCVSPCIANRRLILFRANCLNVLLMSIALLSIASFFCYYLGINCFKAVASYDYALSGGLFGGLFNHSMMLGPMSGISTCYLLWIYFRNKKKWLIIPIVLSAGAMLFSASRAATLSTIVGCVFLSISFFRFNKGIWIVILASAVLCATLPIWQSAMSGINQKNQSNDSLGDFGSRTEKFEARLSEFSTSPLIGIGFVSIDPQSGDDLNIASGRIEPGSSWLCVLSMTGIIGFAFIVSFMAKAFMSARRSQAACASLMSALIAWYAVHLLFEGYIYSGGGPLCFVFWLTIGVATDLKYKIY